ALVAFPSFLLLQSGNPVLVVISLALAVSVLSFPYAASGTVLTGLFSAKTRYTRVALAQNRAGVLPSFVPLMAIALIALVDNHWWPAAVLLVILSLATAVAGALAPRLSVNLPGFKH